MSRKTSDVRLFVMFEGPVNVEFMNGSQMYHHDESKPTDGCSKSFRRRLQVLGTSPVAHICYRQSDFKTSPWCRSRCGRYMHISLRHCYVGRVPNSRNPFALSTHFQTGQAWSGRTVPRESPSASFGPRPYKYHAIVQRNHIRIAAQLCYEIVRNVIARWFRTTFLFELYGCALLRTMPFSVDP